MLLTLSSLALALDAAPPGLRTRRPPCGSMATLPLLEPLPPLPVAPPHPDGDKDTRDVDGEYPNELEGDNFVVKWGDRGRVDEDDVEGLLEAFEYAWESEIRERGMPMPRGTDEYLFNVYIGDTGDGAPDGYGTSGYYNRDADNYPMIVVSAATIADPEWAKGTAAHEFFHALQDATGRYSYTGDSAWYWEATAMWIEGEVFDDYEDYVAFLYGYALLPHLPVHFFDYPDTGALQEYHQYGAMIFPRYVSEVAADWEVVRDSWTEDLGADDPQEALEQLLAERGVSFADAFADFAARNATWDYADGAIYERWVDWYADYYRSDDHRVVDEVGGGGTDGLVAAPADTLPGRLAYNVVTIEPNAGTYTVRFEGAAEGSHGSGAAWRVTLVTEGAGGRTYDEVDLDGGAGALELTWQGDEVVHLVVASVPGSARDDETFDWSYAVTFGAAVEDADPDPIDVVDARAVPIPATCASGASGSPALLGLAAVGWIVGRARASRR